MLEIFETASRKKYRYPYRGSITTEDLWDLGTGQLDTVYKTLMQEAKTAQSDDSLFSEKKENPDLAKKIMIVKYIFGVKQEEAQNAKVAAERKAKKDRLLDILARKEEAALENASEEEIRKMLDDLG